VLEADLKRVAEIADYMKQNPSLNIGLDGHMDPENRPLSDRRVAAMRDSLIKAGMPASHIETGAFGSPAQRRAGRVEVLLRTGKR